MARKHYKNESIMKFLTIIGALVGLATIILSIAQIENYAFYPGIIDVLNNIIVYIIGIVVCVITLITALKPDKLLPFHWLVLFILGILMIVFGGGIWACVLLIIAALIGIIEEL